jgi:filamentous hemagglutinin family protein
LAFAVGLGAAVATGQGVAAAAPSTGGTSGGGVVTSSGTPDSLPPDSPKAKESKTEKQPATPKNPATTTTTPVPPAVSSVAPPPSKTPVLRNDWPIVASAHPRARNHDVHSASVAARSATRAISAPNVQHVTLNVVPAPTALVRAAAAVGSTAAVNSAAAVNAPVKSVNASATPVLTAMSTVLHWVLNPLMNTGPGAPPADTPLGWTMLAAARRDIATVLDDTPSATATQQSSQPATGTAASGLSAVTENSESAQTASTGAAPNARPTGGKVAAGSATISYGSTTTTITQTSNRAVVNFQSFDVGSQQTVTFAQPSASAVTLVRVTGPDPTQIAGRIDSNGQVVVVNRQGMVIATGAELNNAGLILSTAGITNANFMGGKALFNQPGAANASIVMDGLLTAEQGGAVVLLAPQVVVGGTINDKLGGVALVSADAATIDEYGDGLLAITTTKAVTKLPSGASSLVTVNGTVLANGGTVQVIADASPGLLSNVVNVGGTVQTATVGARSGTILITATDGNVDVTGTLSAAGTAAGTHGGDIEVITTNNVTVGSAAHVNATGAAGGGVVALGTTLKRAEAGPGTGSAQTAADVTIDKGARINASALKDGNGGRITILSSDDTDFAGTIVSDGGAAGGNGGFVEVSGGKALVVTGTISVTAAKGNFGTILFDPNGQTTVITGGTFPKLDATQPRSGRDYLW